MLCWSHHLHYRQGHTELVSGNRQLTLECIDHDRIQMFGTCPVFDDLVDELGYWLIERGGRLYYEDPENRPYYYQMQFARRDLDDFQTWCYDNIPAFIF